MMFFNQKLFLSAKFSYIFIRSKFQKNISYNLIARLANSKMKSSIELKSHFELIKFKDKGY